MNLVLVQLDIAWGDVSINHSMVKYLLSQQSIATDSLIILPEMFSTGFDVKSLETIDGENLCLIKNDEFLSNLAQEYNSYVQGSGITLDTIKNKRQNISSIYNPKGELISSYQKIYPFSYSKEDKYFSHGNKIEICKINEFKFSPFICYDLRFPEIFRHAIQKGTEVISVIANWPESRIEHWKSLLIARAIENQAYVVGVNRTGSDPWLKYCGNSMVVAPDGKLVVQADESMQIIQVEIEKKYLDNYRNDFPVIKDLQNHWLGL